MIHTQWKRGHFLHSPTRQRLVNFRFWLGNSLIHQPRWASRKEISRYTSPASQLHMRNWKWPENICLPPANEVCEGYVFTCVCHSVHSGGGGVPGQVPYLGRYISLGRYTPLGQVHPPGQSHPPGEQCMLGDIGNKRPVRILLECILVKLIFCINVK